MFADTRGGGFAAQCLPLMPRKAAAAEPTAALEPHAPHTHLHSEKLHVPHRAHVWRSPALQRVRHVLRKVTACRAELGARHSGFRPARLKQAFRPGCFRAPQQHRLSPTNVVDDVDAHRQLRVRGEAVGLGGAGAAGGGQRLVHLGSLLLRLPELLGRLLALPEPPQQLGVVGARQGQLIEVQLAQLGQVRRGGHHMR